METDHQIGADSSRQVVPGRRLLFLLILTIGSLLAGCDDAQAVKTEETRQRLVGTWLREIVVENAKGRRILVLREDGKFSEALVVDFSDGREGGQTRGGEWSFDGTNLKRRYTHEDGRQLSGNFHFVTFALSAFDGKRFEGRNHDKGEEIMYVKVAEGTQP
jgi:hypothetical protein